jgi:hypothetical protein
MSKPKHLAPYQFKPGVSANPAGRPAGAKNRLQGDFLTALAEDFREHGIGAIRIMRVERPAEYVKCIASLMPKELLVTQDTALSELTDEQLEHALAKVLREKAERPVAVIPDGEVIN